MKMPISCAYCPMVHEDDLGYIYSYCTGKCKEVAEFVVDRPQWCPLMEVADGKYANNAHGLPIKPPSDSISGQIKILYKNDDFYTDKYNTENENKIEL